MVDLSKMEASKVSIKTVPICTKLNQKRCLSCMSCTHSTQYNQPYFFELYSMQTNTVLIETSYDFSDHEFT